MDRTKEAAFQRLAHAHYMVEPGITSIVRLLGTVEEEANPKEPIKLLEVNQNTIAAGIRPIFFGPDVANGIFFPSAIIEVTPEEYEMIRRDPSRLPNGWKLGPAILPPAAAAHA